TAQVLGSPAGPGYSSPGTALQSRRVRAATDHYTAPPPSLPPQAGRSTWVLRRDSNRPCAVVPHIVLHTDLPQHHTRYTPPPGCHRVCYRRERSGAAGVDEWFHPCAQVINPTKKGNC